jgi:hypothetical protein
MVKLAGIRAILTMSANIFVMMFISSCDKEFDAGEFDNTTFLLSSTSEAVAFTSFYSDNRDCSGGLGLCNLSDNPTGLNFEVIFSEVKMEAD